MSLPGPLNKSFFQKKNLEALFLPTLVLLFLLGVLIISIFIPAQNQDNKAGKKKDLSYYTDKVKVFSEGKTIEVSPRVLQIKPKELHESLTAKKDIILIAAIREESEANLPHIAGTRFILEKHFEGFPPLEPEKSYVFVSKDGYDSAVVIDKFIGGVFAPEKNLNLEGGLDAWKKEGFPVEN